MKMTVTITMATVNKCNITMATAKMKINSANMQHNVMLVV